MGAVSAVNQHLLQEEQDNDTSSMTRRLVAFDQPVDPDVIFGSGNANGFFTTSTENGIELGLRSKLRFDGTCAPQNTFNSNGDGTYSFEKGDPCLNGEAEWNFEWTVNSDVGCDILGSPPCNVIGDYDYSLELDDDPSLTVNVAVPSLFGVSQSLPYDPINVPEADHSFGTDTTGNGGGVSSSSAAEYQTFLSTKTVVQQSWRYGFFDAGSIVELVPGFDFESAGIYTITLSAFEKGTKRVLASTRINVLVGLDPADFPTTQSECTNGDWQSFVTTSGDMFKNECECIKFTVSPLTVDPDTDGDGIGDGCDPCPLTGKFWTHRPQEIPSSN